MYSHGSSMVKSLDFKKIGQGLLLTGLNDASKKSKQLSPYESSISIWKKKGTISSWYWEHKGNVNGEVFN